MASSSFGRAAVLDSPAQRRGVAAAVALILVGLNLRIAVAAVPPVLSQIRHETGLSSAGGGLLTAVPVFCFGLAALATPRLIGWLRMAPLLALTMAAVVVGSALRVLPSMVALFVGTAVIGVGIAVGNVLLPSLIKRDFATRIVLMMGLYSLALCVSGAISSGLTVPLDHALGGDWRVAIAAWGAPAAIALVVWLPQARRRDPVTAAPTTSSIAGALWRDPVAWAVTAFMGMQSFGFYALMSWIPTIFLEHGISATGAGELLSYSMFPSMLFALITPAVERRLGRSGPLVGVSVVLCAAAYIGLLIRPASTPYLWMTLLGLGQGTALSLALGFIVKRAPDHDSAAQLSTMAQSVGYLLAASGPFLLGALHGLSGGWSLPFVVLFAALLAVAVAGGLCSRDRVVSIG